MIINEKNKDHIFDSIRLGFIFYAKNEELIIISANHIKCRLVKCHISTTMTLENSFTTKTIL